MEPRPLRYDRRTFLRRAGAAALAAPALPMLGCGSERPRLSPAAEELEDGRVIARPILLPWSADAVRIAAPAPELPAAYVSMRTKELFVDSEFREAAYWELRAHISVSTEVWRIPLPGDPPKEPVQPGDVLREFEELSIREWDPTADPTEGDIRVLRGRRVAVTVDFTCAPLSGGGAWLRAGPWEMHRCEAPGTDLCREDFMSVGTGMRYADRDCSRPRGNVRYVTWASPEPTPSAG